MTVTGLKSKSQSTHPIVGVSCLEWQRSSVQKSLDLYMTSVDYDPAGRSLPRAWDTMISSGEVKNLFFYNVTAHKGPGFFALKIFAILSNLRNQWGLSEVRRLRLWLSFIIEHWAGHAYVDNVTRCTAFGLLNVTTIKAILICYLISL